MNDNSSRSQVDDEDDPYFILPDRLPVLPKSVSAAMKSALQYQRDLPWIFNEAKARNDDFGDKTSRWILKHKDIINKAWLLKDWDIAKTKN